MNRRSFITKALAGLAVVPLIGKLTEAEPHSYAVGEFGTELSVERLLAMLQRADILPPNWYEEGEQVRRTITATVPVSSASS